MNRGHIAWALLAGLASVVFLWTLTSNSGAPSQTIDLFGAERTALEVHGGVGIAYQPVEPASAEFRARAARILGERARRAAAGTRAVSGPHMLTVTIPQVSADEAESLAHALLSNGRLSIHRTHVNDPSMARLCPQLDDAPLADGDARRILCSPDVWTHETIGELKDYQLKAAERAPLERAIAQALERDPDAALTPGRRLVYERVAPTLDPAERRRVPTLWRTYIIDAEPIIDYRDIERAFVTLDQYSNRYATIVELHRDGGRRFGDATARLVGHKLAILLGDTVQSAPVVQTAIRGGSLMVTTGATDPRTSRAEAEFMANTFAANSDEDLPVKLRVADIAPLEPTVTSGELRAAAEVFVLLAGSVVALLVWLVLAASGRWGGHWLVPLVELDPELRGGRSPWLRALVTLAALVGIYFSAQLLLPAVNLEQLAAAMRAGAEPSRDALVQFSIVALGVAPIISAFVLVEIAALATPRWRAWRRPGPAGGPRGRARLLPAVIALSIVLAIIQGYAITVWLASMAPGPIHPGSLASRGDMIATALTLAGGVMVMWVAAALVSRHGLGNGLSVLLFGGCLAGLETWYHQLETALRIGEMTGLDLAWLLGAVVATIMATNLLLRTRIGGVYGLRAPCSGIVPLVEVMGLFGLLASAVFLTGDSSLGEWLITGPMAWVAELSPETTSRPLLFSMLLVAATVLFSWLFSRPQPLIPGARLIDRGADRSEQWSVFVRATALSALYLGFISWLSIVQSRYGLAIVDVLSLVLLTAIAMDLGAEWRARRRIPDPVTVRIVHQVQSVDLVLDALVSAEIPAYARTRYHRALLFFFGPYLPIEIMVARTDVESAHDLLSGLFGDAPESTRVADDSDQPGADEPSAA